MRVRPVNNSRFDMVTDTDNPRNKAVRLAEKMLKKVQTDLPDSFEMPPVAVVDYEKQGLNANAIGGFHEASGRLFIGVQCLSPAKKYKLYKSSINKSIHFVQRSLSSSTRVQRVTAQLNLSRE